MNTRKPSSVLAGIGAVSMLLALITYVLLVFSAVGVFGGNIGEEGPVTKLITDGRIQIWLFGVGFLLLILALLIGRKPKKDLTAGK